jgi:hypothetical protein
MHGTKNIKLRFALLTKEFSGDKVKEKEMSGTCSTYGELRWSVGVPKGKRQLGNRRCRRECKFKFEPPSKLFGAWTNLAQDEDGLLLLYNMKLRGFI